MSLLLFGGQNGETQLEHGSCSAERKCLTELLRSSVLDKSMPAAGGAEEGSGCGGGGGWRGRGGEEEERGE